MTIETNAEMRARRHVFEEHPEAMQHCPRGPAPGGPFKPPFDGSAYWRTDRTCSFCGSLHPDDFMAAIEAGATVIPTDKDYKAYIRVPDPRGVRIVGVTNNEDRPSEQWTPAEAVSDEELVKSGFRRLASDRWYMRGESKTLDAKFYYHHLSPAQRLQFILLYNEKRMSIADPGYFYVPPFFCEVAWIGARPGLDREGEG